MFNLEFFGSATIGEKGQVVIPVSARTSLDLKTGDKLLVMQAPDNRGLVLVKPDALKTMVSEMSEKFKNFGEKIADEEVNN